MEKDGALFKFRVSMPYTHTHGIPRIVGEKKGNGKKKMIKLLTIQEYLILEKKEGKGGKIRKHVFLSIPSLPFPFS